jgi:hypothetical protein
LVINSATVWFNSNVDYPYGWPDAATACANGGSYNSSTVYYTGTLGNGTVLYFNSNLTYPFDTDGSFGWYWIGGYRFEYAGSIFSYAACPSYPANATLTFDNYAAGTATFILSGILSAQIEITSWEVNGYNTGACIEATESDQYSTTITWTSGQSGVKTGTGFSAITCDAIRITKTNSLFVAVAGGSSGNYSNGQTFTVGSTTVTVSINTACTGYPC